MDTVVQWNIRGFRSNFEELKLLQNRSQSAVVALFPQGGSPGGEAALLIRNGSPFSEIDLKTGLHDAAAAISLEKTLTVCSLYLPPNSPVSKLSLAELFEQLAKPFLRLRWFQFQNPGRILLILERMVNDRWSMCLSPETCCQRYSAVSGRTIAHWTTWSDWKPLSKGLSPEKKQVLVVFFDLEKAYDTSWRYGILKDLFDLDFRGRLPIFISNFLKDRHYKVKAENTFSSSYHQENGVPQGSILSSMLFNLKINNIINSVSKHVNAYLFVDDFAIYAEGKHLQHLERTIQLCINNVQKWVSENGFRFSVSKTTCVHFYRERQRIYTQPALHLDGQPIWVKGEAKLLGVVFDSKLTFSSHVKYLKKKCLKILNLLRIVGHTNWGADRATLLKLYRTLVRSKLDYGSVVFGSAKKNILKALDPIHHQGLRIALGAFRTSPIKSLYAEAGEPSLEHRHIKLACNYVLKLKSLPGIQWNANVDNLAKAALNRASCSGKLICWSDLKPNINAYIHSVWQKNWDADLYRLFREMLYMALVLYAPSLALNAVTGFSLWGAVISVGVVCTIYTALGGMKAVLWTDSFQVIMMMVGLLAVLIRGATTVGSWDAVWDSAKRTGRVKFDDFRVDPSVRHSVWALVIGTYFTWVSVYGTNQAQVQRAATCRTLKDAQIAMWMNFPGLCIILYMCCFIGIYMAAFYENCDPLKAKFVGDSNQLLPIFVMDVLGDMTGLPGLFVAGLFSGALSTISSGLNSISAAILEDCIHSYLGKSLREKKARLISQILAMIFGAICLCLTYVASLLGSILQAALSLYGMIGGPLLGLFSLGMFFPWANSIGALSGLFGSLIFMFWIGVGAAIEKPPQTKALRCISNCNITAFDNQTLTALYSPWKVAEPYDTSPPNQLYTLSYLWYSATALAACVIIGLIVSFITGHQKPKDIDPRLIVPLCDVIFPFNFLPEKIRKPLRFGINHEGKYNQDNIHDGAPVEFGAAILSEIFAANERASKMQCSHEGVNNEDNAANDADDRYDENGKIETKF
ncbi:sodium-coupled monocarboxylate transporter [Plakobranchus ocellatus]|uniref:Sodium-coupled monocarboxylate transporter n=1 Tax=Plakobranchus ocellatus TaxID=259542 RepID=A0AAV3YHM5_9GAST|nr:sodium-coupled monocarboxylate transporter [Plakobranchus ocellatus]